MQEPYGQQHEERQWLRLSSKTILIFLGAGALVGSTIVIALHFAFPKPTIPEKIAQQLLFPLYVPVHLPGTFALQPDTFRVKDGTLIMYAADQSGNRLGITESALSSNINPSSAFGPDLIGARKITGVSSLTISGKLVDGEKLLSVSIANTWVIFTYRTALSDGQLRGLASNLVLQK